MKFSWVNVGARSNRRGLGSFLDIPFQPSKFVRCTDKHPCPVCGRLRWCMYSPDGKKALCMWLESKQQAKGDRGWIHNVDGTPIEVAKEFIPRPTGKKPTVDVLAVYIRYRDHTLQEDILKYAKSLGVSSTSLKRIGICKVPTKNAWAFPMYGIGTELCGLRIRSIDGKSKWSLKGSRSGVFVPSFLFKREQRMLYITEGPTDTAALLDLGLDVVGRPCCLGNHNEVIDVVSSSDRWLDVVIFADNDPAGLDGAGRLASVLVKYTKSIKIITPPGECDARQYIVGGATLEDIEALVDETNYFRREDVASGVGQTN